MVGAGLDFRILGSLEVTDGERRLALGPPKQRALLALLLLRLDEPVASDTLIESLWGERPPQTAATAVQGYVSQLRKLLGPDTIATEASGYRLAAARETLDAVRFERLLERGREELASRRTAAAAATL